MAIKAPVGYACQITIPRHWAESIDLSQLRQQEGTAEASVTITCQYKHNASLSFSSVWFGCVNDSELCVILGQVDLIHAKNLFDIEKGICFTVSQIKAQASATPQTCEAGESWGESVLQHRENTILVGSSGGGEVP